MVAAFKTYEMADLRTQIRFENFSHSTMFGGTKFPGIRIEKLDKRSSGDRARPTTGGSTGWRKPTKHVSRGARNFGLEILKRSFKVICT